jgi:hypothetical protein
LAGHPLGKSGLTSAPRRPQAWRVNRDSRSDNLTSSAHLLPDSDWKLAASRLYLLMYMNKTVRFFGRIVARPIQHASLFVDNENHPKPAEDGVLQMEGCSENASKIELEIRLAKLNWILRQLQDREGLIYQTTTRTVARSRSHTQSASRPERRVTQNT